MDKVKNLPLNEISGVAFILMGVIGTIDSVYVALRNGLSVMDWSLFSAIILLLIGVSLFKKLDNLVLAGFISFFAYRIHCFYIYSILDFNYYSSFQLLSDLECIVFIVLVLLSLKFDKHMLKDSCTLVIFIYYIWVLMSMVIYFKFSLASILAAVAYTTCALWLRKTKLVLFNMSGRVQ